jgi:broad specificity phosphatase PhoE
MKNVQFLSYLIALVATAAPTLCSALSDTPKTTTVMVVRHAEKQDATDGSGLTPAGEERARRLRDLSLEAGVSALFATQYRRTQATLRPLAEALGLDTVVIEARDTAALVAKILAEHRGDVVIVAGHSNTVPGIVAALGAPEPEAIAETEYGNLFIVTIPGTDPPTALRLKF